MTQTKKYDCRIVQGKDGWSAEIIRRVTTKKTAVSKTQDGFATEAEAQAWGEKELKSFLASLTERNKRDSEQHRQKKQEQASRGEKYRQSKKD